MNPIHDDTPDANRPLTEADRTSETRFGPRPVPPGHQMPHARRVLPSGRVSPDGRSSYPTPATGTKIAVWGGIALGVAGGTAAAVLAVRKIAEALSDDSHPGKHKGRHPAPHFVTMDEDERDAMRSRVHNQEREDRQHVARLRDEASRRRSSSPRKAKKGNFAESLIETSTKLSESLEGVAKSMAMAVESFRGVARQATGIVQEFAGAADQLRSALRGENPQVDLRDPRRTDGDDRTHRL